MSWYRIGTVTVTSGGSAVVGAGTSWLDNAQAGDGFRGPDGRVYEILTVDSDTAITLAENYLGSNAAGAAYGIFATQARIVALAQQVAQLLADYSGVLTGAGAGKFGNGTEAAPGISFAADLDTGFYRVASNTIGTVTAGVLRTAVTAAGDYGVGTQAPNKLTVSRAITVNGSLNSAFEVAAGDVSCGWLFGSPSRVTLETNGAIPLTINVNGSERERVLTTGQHLINRTTDSGLGLLQLNDTVGAIADLASSRAGGPAYVRVRHTEAQIVGIAVQNQWTGTDATSGLRMLVDGTGQAYVSQEEGQSLYLQTNGSVRVELDGTAGNVIQSAPAAPPALARNGTLVLNLTSNTNLRISARGSDGVTRVANIALA